MLLLALIILASGCTQIKQYQQEEDPANISVVSFNVPDTPRNSEKFDVSITLRNNGDEAGNFTSNLTINSNRSIGYTANSVFLNGYTFLERAQANNISKKVNVDLDGGERINITKSFKAYGSSNKVVLEGHNISKFVNVTSPSELSLGEKYINGFNIGISADSVGTSNHYTYLEDGEVKEYEIKGEYVFVNLSIQNRGPLTVETPPLNAFHLENGNEGKEDIGDIVVINDGESEPIRHAVNEPSFRPKYYQAERIMPRESIRRHMVFQTDGVDKNDVKLVYERSIKNPVKWIP